MSSHVAHNYDDPAATPRLCQNCATPLRGPYCSRCGQHDIDYHRSFHYLAHDLLENLFHFDGKIPVTVAWLLAKPGKLTAEFNAGRRQSQVPPLRLYIFVTVLFFLGVHLLNHGHLIDFDRSAVDQSVSRIEQQHRAADALAGNLTSAQRDDLHQFVDEATVAKGSRLNDDTIREIVRRVRNGERPTSSGHVRGVTVTADQNSAFGSAFSKKIASGELTFSTLVDEFEHRVPMALFLGMPAFALLLKIFYLRSGRYYIEHLTFSLHLHTWGFLALMTGNGYFKLTALGPGWLTTAFGWFFLVWMLWYVLAAFHRLYGQSWMKTAVKLVPLGFAYATVLVAVTVLVITVTVLWLMME